MMTMMEEERGSEVSLEREFDAGGAGSSSDIETEAEEAGFGGSCLMFVESETILRRCGFSMLSSWSSTRTTTRRRL